MRTPAGSVVTVTGDLVAACLTVTIDAPLVLPGAAATFKTAIEKGKLTVSVSIRADDFIIHFFYSIFYQISICRFYSDAEQVIRNKVMRLNHIHFVCVCLCG